VRGLLIWLDVYGTSGGECVASWIMAGVVGTRARSMCGGAVGSAAPGHVGCRPCWMFIVGVLFVAMLLDCDVRESLLNCDVSVKSLLNRDFSVMS
jgi:hypothetical protein